MSKDITLKEITRILENPFWIPGLSSNDVYQRLHDDHDGTLEGKIIIQIDQTGDVFFQTDTEKWQPMRFRTIIGGGRSLRTRNALILLAFAMKLDNEERPDPN